MTRRVGAGPISDRMPAFWATRSCGALKSIASTIPGKTVSRPCPREPVLSARSQAVAVTWPSAQSFFLLRGSSSGLAYLMDHGPMPWNWITVSPVAQTKCFIPAGQCP